MIWVFSSVALGIAVLLVFAAGGSDGRSFFQFALDSPNSAGWPVLLSFAVAIFVACWFAHAFGKWSESSGPPADLPGLEQPRAFTTSLRFWLWSVLYGIFIAAAFLMVVFFPEVASLLLRALGAIFPLGDLDGNTLGVGADLEGGLVTGVIMATLFARSVYEGQLRRFFQSRALIPEEARRIYLELKRTIFDYRPPEDDLEAFLEGQRRNPRTPTYFEFEFDIDRVQQADGRMELLPRIAFMSWQAERLRSFHNGFLALHRSSEEIDRMRASIIAFEDKALTCQKQLLSVLDGLLELEKAVASDPFVGANDADVAARDLDVHARVAANTDLNAELLETRALPVSRLDNIADALIDELNTLGARLGRYNELQAQQDTSALDRLGSAAETGVLAEDAAAFDHGAGRVTSSGLRQDRDRLKARLETLRAQIAAVQKSLVPVAVGRLEALDEKMETDNADLVALAEKYIGVIVCAGLAADTTPERSFFQAFGLNPTLAHVRFRFERAIWLLAAPLLLYLAFLIANSVMRGVIPGFDFVIWFLLGFLFIIGSVIYGCVHGSAMASIQLEAVHRRLSNPNSPQDAPPDEDFTVVHGISAFVFSTAFLIIGLFGLCLLLAVDQSGKAIDDAHAVFRGAWPFATVAAGWSVVCAYVTVRACLNVSHVIRTRDWVVFPALTFLTIGTILGFFQTTGMGTGVPWEVVFPLGIVLTLVLLLGARSVVQET